MADEDGARVLVLPYPAQGHINPMLQFAKRLAFHGIRPSIAVTRFILKNSGHSLALSTASPAISIIPYSDGCDADGFFEVGESIPAYLSRLESYGSSSLRRIFATAAEEGRRFRCLIYDPFLPWAPALAAEHAASAAAFFTQSCAVETLYSHAEHGLLPPPQKSVAGVGGKGSPIIYLPALPPLKWSEVVTFLSSPDGGGPLGPYAALLKSQFKNLHEVADAVLLNSFYELEPEEAKWLEKAWGAKTVGPTLPSAYLDGRIAGDTDYVFHLHATDSTGSLRWLDKHPAASVIYVSFGTMAVLDKIQKAELAGALKSSGHPFFWVVRASETEKLPPRFLDELGELGFVLNWSPQLEVLNHKAVGCFVTHCGWNSTMEAVSFGVPMVAMPWQSDQPTNAKYVEDVWRVGVRAVAVAGDDEGGGGGVVRKEELERCLKIVMEDKGEEMRRRASELGKKARAAVDSGGSSDVNIREFIAKLCR